MKIITTKRNVFGLRSFLGGVVSPQVPFENSEDIANHRAPMAKGIVINDIWHELPDNPDGEYVLIETLPTNDFGYYEPGRARRELVTRAYADTVGKRTGRGIVNQVAVIRITGDEIECDYDSACLVRKQGV
ncbi:MAG: hypothetical protein U5L11_02555 [Arhodomonas sp.]|nr:hypothetical protein [Arhodomonas sp.]